MGTTLKKKRILKISENQVNNKIIETQKKIIEELRQQLEVIVENISDALVLFDKGGNYSALNELARKKYLPLLQNKNANEVEYYDANGHLMENENTPINRIARGEKLSGNRIAIKSSQEVVFTEINGTPIYDPEGNFIAGILYCRDVTEQVKYEVILKNQHDVLYKMIDTLDLPLIRLSYPALTVIDINQKALEIVKATNKEIKSVHYFKGNKGRMKYDYYLGANYDEYINKAAMEKKITYLKQRKYIINEIEVYTNIIFEPVILLNGTIDEIIMVMVDVTNEVKAKKELETTLQLQEEFVANISHELRTPINVIFSAIQMFDYNIRAHENCTCDNKKYVKMMKQNCFRLLKLVNNLIDISKIECGYFNLSLGNHNIVNILEEITLSVIEYANSKGVEIIFDTSIEEKIIAFDPDIIERIILNLISNALKFTSAGDKIYVKFKSQRNKVSIIVKDTGIGIPDDKQEVIFERFKQVDKSFARTCEGSGIGLSLVKLLVEMHQGKIYVNSVVDEGSEFTIELPVKLIEENNYNFKMNVSSLQRNVDRINIEFSDIYS